MRYQRIEGCSLERMIGFIIEINQIEKLQFIFFITRERKRLVKVNDKDVFSYKENKLRHIYSLLPVGETILPDWIKTFGCWFQRKKEENFGLTSKVKLEEGQVQHIPMVDFMCPCSDQGPQRVVDTLSVLGEREGFIVESGKSYHYWGIHLLSEEEWRNFMRRRQTQEIIGYDWPFSQLQDGFSVLRISTSPTKPHLPKVIARIGDFEF